MTNPQAPDDEPAPSLASLKPSGTIHLSGEDALAFLMALVEPVTVTPAQIELGRLMRALPDEP